CRVSVADSPATASGRVARRMNTATAKLHQSHGPSACRRHAGWLIMGVAFRIGAPRWLVGLASFGITPIHRLSVIVAPEWRSRHPRPSLLACAKQDNHLAGRGLFQCHRWPIAGSL